MMLTGHLNMILIDINMQTVMKAAAGSTVKRAQFLTADRSLWSTGALSGSGLGLWILPSYPLFASSVSLIPNGLFATVAVSSPLVQEFRDHQHFCRLFKIPTMEGAKAVRFPT